MSGRLRGVRIGVTAGPTRAWIDDVRYIANASSGQLGALIADGLAAEGAKVEGVWGRGALYEPLSPAVNISLIDSPSELAEEFESLSRSHASHPFQCWIHAMAVLDYVPAARVFGKADSTQDSWSLQLVRTPKLIQQIKLQFPGCLLVGFKLLSTDSPDELREAAAMQSREAGCDLVAANPSPFKDPAGHTAWLYDAASGDWMGPYRGKESIAQAILSWVVRNRG